MSSVWSQAELATREILRNSLRDFYADFASSYEANLSQKGDTTMWLNQPRNNHHPASQHKSPPPRRLEVEALEERTLLSTGIAGGNEHSCALTSVGGVKCWGENIYGEVGDGLPAQRVLTPVDVVGLSSGVSAVTAGESHSCALTTAGSVKCWGKGAAGELGDGARTDSAMPVDVVGLSSGVIAISAGTNYTCAITSAGGVKCWGSNNYGQRGDGTTQGSATPVDVVGLSSGVVAIAAGNTHTCAITDAGGVKCWGKGNNGELGDGTSTQRLTPVDVSGLAAGVSSIVVGGAGNPGHSCAVTVAGAAKCWGANYHGELGDKSTVNRSTPVNVFGLSSGVAGVTAGPANTCAVTTTGAAKCWGQGDTLGDGKMCHNVCKNSTIPVNVVGLDGTTTRVTEIEAGKYHTLARTAAGGIKSWGSNFYGELGDGTTTDRLTPVDVVGFGGGAIAAATGTRQLQPAVHDHVHFHHHRSAIARATRVVDQAVAGLVTHHRSSRFGRSHELKFESDLWLDVGLRLQRD
jgi:alpha-tubulin suppressor-like RCC1 family protein